MLSDNAYRSFTFTSIRLQAHTELHAAVGTLSALGLRNRCRFSHVIIASVAASVVVFAASVVFPFHRNIDFRSVISMLIWSSPARVDT
jgi:hypothetical protein